MLGRGCRLQQSRHMRLCLLANSPCVDLLAAMLCNGLDETLLLQLADSSGRGFIELQSQQEKEVL